MMYFFIISLSSLQFTLSHFILLLHFTFTSLHFITLLCFTLLLYFTGAVVKSFVHIVELPGP